MHPVKRKRRSVKRPRSGNRITQEQYDTLAQAYFTSQNINEAASMAGVTAKTAGKYVNRGDKFFPAIKDRMHKINETALAAQDAHQVERRRFVLTQIDTLLDQAAGVLNSIDLKLTGKKVLDARGDPVLGADGQPMVQIDLSEFDSIITVFSKLAAVRDKLTGDDQEAPAQVPSFTQVNILDKDSVAAAAGHILSRSLGSHVGQPNKEEGLKSVLAATARGRVIDVVPND